MADDDSARDDPAGGDAGGDVAGGDAAGAAMDRLERALARIEAGVERPDPVQAEVAARLDAVIARLRAELED